MIRRFVPLPYVQFAGLIAVMALAGAARAAEPATDPKTEEFARIVRVLDKIEQQDYRVLAKRPAISRGERVRLLMGSLLRVAFTKAA